MYVVELAQSLWGRRFKSRDGLNLCVYEWVKRVSIISNHWSIVIQLSPVLRRQIQHRQPLTVCMIKSLWSVGVIAWACAFRQGFEPLFFALKSILNLYLLSIQVEDSIPHWLIVLQDFCIAHRKTFHHKSFRPYISYRNEDSLFSSILGNRYQNALYSSSVGIPTMLCLILSQWPSNFYITQSCCLKDL